MDNGRMAFGAMSLFLNLVLIGVAAILFLLGHFYIVNGLMLGFLPFIMMSNAGYSTGACLAVYAIIVLASVVLQKRFKLARILFGIFSCCVVALFCWDAQKEAALNTQVFTIGAGIAITALLNFVGACRQEEF